MASGPDSTQRTKPVQGGDGRVTKRLVLRRVKIISGGWASWKITTWWNGAEWHTFCPEPTIRPIAITLMDAGCPDLEYEVRDKTNKVRKIGRSIHKIAETGE